MENTVGFQDILKKSFLTTDYVTPLTSASIAMNLLVTFLAGLFIFYIYKFFYGNDGVKKRGYVFMKKI